MHSNWSQPLIGLSKQLSVEPLQLVDRIIELSAFCFFYIQKKHISVLSETSHNEPITQNPSYNETTHVTDWPE